MIPYSHKAVFTGVEIAAWRHVAALVGRLPDDVLGGRVIRCHELARAVSQSLDGNMPVVDGMYGAVEHTWLWTRKPTTEEQGTFGAWFHPARPRILDVYAVGTLPQVQLIDTWSLLPPTYHPGAPRDDIREDDVEAILEAWR